MISIIDRFLKNVYIYIYTHTMTYIRRPRLQQGERVRGGITSSKGQEVITSSKGKKQENKKEEARTRSNPRRPGPSLRALLFGCGAGAVLGQTARFSCRFRHSRPWLAGPVRLSGPGCLAVVQAPFWVRQLGFLVGSESNVRHWGPWPAGPVRPSGPCCFGVAKAPFVSLRGWKTDSSES